MKMTLTSYVRDQLKETSDFHFNNTLYLIYCYYGGMFSHKKEFSEYLFEGEFLATNYGVTVSIIDEPLMEDLDEEVKRTINHLVKEVNKIDVFSLVDKVHQDDEWFTSYNERDNKVLSNENMIANYQKHFGTGSK